MLRLAGGGGALAKPVPTLYRAGESTRRPCAASSPRQESSFLEAAESKKQSVNSDTVTGILKRIIAENGRDHLWGYVFAIACLVVVALSTAFTAWTRKT